MGAGEKGMERDYEYTVACNPQALWSAERVGQGAAQRTLARLDPRTIPTQKIPILFDRTLSSGLISHFIAAISGGNLFRKASFLCDSLGKRVFPTAFSLYEEPYLIGKMGSSPFDADGVATLARPLVQKGAIQSYVLSAYSARQLGLSNTGNAGGVTNLRVEYPCVTQSELVKQLYTGLWVTELMGHGINLITGDYSRGAAGFWVEKGHIQYPVSGVTIAGHLGEMLANIVGVGDDVDERSSVFVGSILIDSMMVAGG
jgi:PmbA protein